MFVKRIIIYDLMRELQLSKGINVLPNEDSFEFDCIAFALGLIPSKISRDFDYDLESKTGNRSNVGIVCDFNGTEICWNREYGYDGINYSNDEKIKIEEQPVLVYYSNRMIDTYHYNFESDNCFHINDEDLYRNIFDKYGFIIAQEAMAKLFVDRIKLIANNETNSDRFKYLNFHCENLKRIVNGAIGILNFHDFDFNISKRCFTFKKNNVTYESVRQAAIPYLIGISLDLYYRCMIKNKSLFDDVLLADGVALINVNFGERPSYSDNKWKYYHFFEKEFPNIQLIAL